MDVAKRLKRRVFFVDRPSHFPYHIDMAKTTQSQPAPPESQRQAQVQAPLQMAFVVLGDIMFHTKWFHSAGVAPIPKSNPPRPSDGEDQLELTINLVSTQGMGPGFKIAGSVEEISQAYASLMRQLGFLTPEMLQQMSQQMPQRPEPEANEIAAKKKEEQDEAETGKSGKDIS